MGGISAPKDSGLAAFLDVSALQLLFVGLLLSEQHGDNTALSGSFHLGAEPETHCHS